MRNSKIRLLIMIIAILSIVGGTLYGQAAPKARAAGSACSVTYTVQNQWTGGFTASLNITNLGSTALNGWTLVFTFPGSQQVTQLWNGNVSQSGNTVTI